MHENILKWIIRYRIIINIWASGVIIKWIKIWKWRNKIISWVVVTKCLLPYSRIIHFLQPSNAKYVNVLMKNKINKLVMKTLIKINFKTFFKIFHWIFHYQLINSKVFLRKVKKIYNKINKWSNKRRMNLFIHYYLSNNKLNLHHIF